MGLFSYKIRPYAELEYESVIHNTGYIYFDNNPAIVTNTTWNTIYDCNSSLSDFTLSDLELCENEELNLESTGNYIEDYSWEINGFNMGDTESVSYTPTMAQDYEIVFTAENPICESTSSETIEVFDGPNLTVTDSVSVCLGSEIIITASSDAPIEWVGYGTGDEISITPSEDEIIEVISETEWCTHTEEVLVFVEDYPDLIVSDDLILCEPEEVQLTAESDYAVSWGDLGDGNEITVTPTVTTSYEVSTTNEFDCTTIEGIEVIVSFVSRNHQFQMMPKFALVKS